MAETLEQGPIHFFDQAKPKRKRDKKKQPRKQLGDSGYTNPHEQRFYREPRCTGEHMEVTDDLVKNNIAKQTPFSPPSSGPLVFQTICKEPFDLPSYIPSHLLEETLQPVSLDEYKCTAVTILRELEDMLRCFSKYKISLPRGIANILNYSWKELVEDACCNKKYFQEPTYKNVKPKRRQSSEESSRLSSTSEYTDDEMAANIKSKSKNIVDFSTDVVKGSENPGPLFKKSDVSQQDASDSLATISFSLSSELCKERGWVSQHSDSDTKGQEWKIPYIWALERLQLAKIQINNIAMIYNWEGGMVSNKDGEILRQWKWLGAGKLDDPVIIQVNEYITVKIAGRFAVSLIYKCKHETVNLSLSPVRGVAASQRENLGQIFSEVRLLSKSVKAFTEMHSRILKKEEENKYLKKEGTKKSQIPEENLNHMKDFSAMRKLRVLRRKIKSILEDWMEYYRRAFEISSPHIYKNSTFPQRGGRQWKVQFVSTFLDPHSTQEEKNNDHEAFLSHYVSPFQSAPAYSHLTRNVPSTSRSPQLLSNIFKSNQAVQSHFILKKDKPLKSLTESFHTACPVALRRTMLGHKTKTCRCSNYQIPYVTDLEYDHIINNRVSCPEQIIVICVNASLGTAYDAKTDEDLEKLYERKNKNRSMPCTQGCLDSFRLLKYDINSADVFTGHGGPLLVKRHNIGPGMFLMYIQGKLLFANYIFNGYSKSMKDLQKQIALTRSNYNNCYYLPADYRFSSVKNSLQNYPEHTQGRTSEDISR